MNSKSKKAVTISIIVCILIGTLSFFVLSAKFSSPDMFDQTIMSLDEKKATVTKMTGISTAMSIAIAAVPGDATSPIANKMVDISGYLLIVMTLILLEKYLVTLTGMLAFKLLIPLACGLLIAFSIFRRDFLKQIALKFALFGIIIVFVIPTSVMVSDIIETTYEESAAYSIEEMEQVQTEFEKKSDDKNLWENVTDKVSNGVNGMVKKAENVMNGFIERIAVMLVVNLAIPLLILMLFSWLIKSFFGINITLPKNRKPHEIIKGKSSKKLPAEQIEA